MRERALERRLTSGASPSTVPSTTTSSARTVVEHAVRARAGELSACEVAAAQHGVVDRQADQPLAGEVQPLDRLQAAE